MAPTWITAVKPTTASSSTLMFIRPSASFRCPVEDTGRNSVTPSTTPRMTAWPTPMALMGGPVPWSAGTGPARSDYSCDYILVDVGATLEDRRPDPESGAVRPPYRWTRGVL